MANVGLLTHPCVTTRRLIHPIAFQIYVSEKPMTCSTARVLEMIALSYGAHLEVNVFEFGMAATDLYYRSSQLDRWQTESHYMVVARSLSRNVCGFW